MALKEKGSFFNGWTSNAVILAVLGSAGGLLVALTMKYTDAVLKTFATSGAIIVTAVAGRVLLDAPLDIPIGIGAVSTVLSLLNYSDEGSNPTDAEQKQTTPTRGWVATDEEADAAHDDNDESSTSPLIEQLETPAHSAA